MSGTTGLGQTIAVIDSYFDTSLAIFSGRIVGGFDYGDNDADFSMPQNCGSNSHGTKVASIAAGVNGVAPDSNLALLKLTRDQSCQNSNVLEGNLHDSLLWVLQNKDDLNISAVNISGAADVVGGNPLFNTIAECEDYLPLATGVLQDLVDQNVAVVAAAGNNKDFIAWPGCLTSTIAVGASYDDDIDFDQSSANGIPTVDWGSFSCLEEECPLEWDSMEQISVHTSGPYEGDIYVQGGGGASCPGVDRVTCYSASYDSERLDLLAPSNCASASLANGGTDDCFDGTSAAAPFVSGLVALLTARAGGTCLSVEEIETILKSSPVLVTDAFSGIATPRVDANVITDLVGINQCDVPDEGNGTLHVGVLVAVLFILL